MFNYTSFLVFILTLLIPSLFYGQDQETKKIIDKINNVENIVNNVDEVVGEIDKVFTTVTESKAYSTLVNGTSIKIPFGIPTPGGGEDYMICVSNLRMSASKGMMVQTQMKIPIGGEQYLYFLADEVPLSKKGEMTGEFNMVLVESELLECGGGYSIYFKGLDSDMVNPSYVTFDCKGFKGIQINGELRFNEDVIQKFNTDENVEQPLAIDFFAAGDRADNFILTISDVPEFQFTQMPGFRCQVDMISLDKSSAHNATNFEPAIRQVYTSSMVSTEEDDTTIDQNTENTTNTNSGTGENNTETAGTNNENTDAGSEGSTQLAVANANSGTGENNTGTNNTNSENTDAGSDDKKDKTSDGDSDGIDWDGEFSSIWEGLIVNNLRIELPGVLKNEAEGSVGYMQVDYFVVDDNGVSLLLEMAGKVYDTHGNFIKDGDIVGGDMEGFKYSLKTAEVKILENDLVGAGFTGDIVMPICKQESTLSIGLTIEGKTEESPLSYSGFAELETANDLEVDALGVGTMNLSGCSIEFEYKSKRFFPTAYIDGDLLVGVGKKSGDGSPDKEEGEMEFEFGGLVIDSRSPYIYLQSSNLEEELTGYMEEKEAEIRGMVEDEVDKQTENAKTKINELTQEAQDKFNDAKNKANEVAEQGKQLMQDGKEFVDSKKQAIEAFIRMKENDINSKLQNLPVSFMFNGMKTDDKKRTGLDFDVYIKLQKSDGEDNEGGDGFGGEAALTLWATRGEDKRWKYDELEVGSILVEVKNGGYEMRGTITKIDSETDRGFCGTLDIKVIDKIAVKGAALFGYDKDEKFRYWFVDAYASFTPLTIAPGVAVNSFTGGLYHHMNMHKEVPKGTKKPIIACESASGLLFTKTKDLHVGVLAGIGLQSAGGGNAFNGKINIGVEILKGGTVNKVSTWGGVAFMTKKFKVPKKDVVLKSMDVPDDGKTVEKKEEVEKKNEDEEKKEDEETGVSGSVVADWYVEYDFPNETFVGDFDIYVDVAGVIEGVHKKKKAGHVSMYSSPDTWYVYVGQPAEMVGLKVFKLATIQSYLCFGKKLPTPEIASMPEEIGVTPNIDKTLLESASGMTFGARMNLDETFEVDLWPCNIKAGLRFWIMAGFDILIAQTQEPVSCGSIEKRGINNWYATGQLYFYGGGEVFASWDCFAGSGDKTLFRVFLKTYLFAQLPNPTYLSGRVEFGIKILTFDPTAEFDIEFGDQCVKSITDNNVKYIASITPVHESEEVDVGTKIDVLFYSPMGEQAYTIDVPEKDKGETRTADDFYKASFRPNLIGYKEDNKDNVKGKGLIVRYKGGDIDFDYEFNENKTSLQITPKRVLPENAEIEVLVNVEIQQNDGKGWYNSGMSEADTSIFKTKAETDKVPVKYIEYAYPLPNMKSFYKNETTDGYIKFAPIPNKPGQLPDESKYGVKYGYTLAIFSESQEIDRTDDVEYNEDLGEFDFRIPTARLVPETEYTLKIFKSPALNNVSEVASSDDVQSGGTLHSQKPETLVVEYNFTTSAYDNFKDKMSYYSSSVTEVFNGVAETELSYNKALAGGIEFESLTEEEKRGYFISGMKTAEPLIQFGKMSLLDGTELTGEVSVLEENDELKLIDNSVDVVSQQMKNLNMNCLLSGSCTSEQAKSLSFSKGGYILPIEYRLPGTNRMTSRVPITLKVSEDIIVPQ